MKTKNKQTTQECRPQLRGSGFYDPADVWDEMWLKSVDEAFEFVISRESRKPSDSRNVISCANVIADLTDFLQRDV